MEFTNQLLAIYCKLLEVKKFFNFCGSISVPRNFSSEIACAVGLDHAPTVSVFHLKRFAIYDNMIATARAHVSLAAAITADISADPYLSPHHYSNLNVIISDVITLGME